MLGWVQIDVKMKGDRIKDWKKLCAITKPDVRRDGDVSPGWLRGHGLDLANRSQPAFYWPAAIGQASSFIFRKSRWRRDRCRVKEERSPEWMATFTDRTAQGRHRSIYGHCFTTETVRNRLKLRSLVNLKNSSTMISSPITLIEELVYLILSWAIQWLHSFRLNTNVI